MIASPGKPATHQLPFNTNCRPVATISPPVGGRRLRPQANEAQPRRHQDDGADIDRRLHQLRAERIGQQMAKCNAQR